MLMERFDIIVIGAGHAGCESGLAAVRMGKKTLILATCLETVAFCACNPSIGGTAKGQIVKDIDALGGEMGKNADKSLLQLRMLNKGKGPAVYSPRAQVDKNKYHIEMKKTLESTENLTLRQAEAVKIENTIDGYIVHTAVKLHYEAKAVIVACGVYLKSRVIIGKYTRNVGPNGFMPANELSQSLLDLGFSLRRFKTGTPARIAGKSVNFSIMDKQEGDNDMLAFSSENVVNLNKYPCYLTYTTEKTKEIILQNKDKAPIFSGEIDGVGPRYCPSIEDKVVRFADKERHQIFMEPESADTDEWYVQGVSSSMPAEIQYEIYKTIKGLENVRIMRDAYAIEYDCIDPLQLFPTLMSKNCNGLFFAGQINGTSGYEEAAGQGLIAGINAVRYIDKKDLLVLRRDQSYIGVLIDDITTKGTNEPYRMMTGRAEYRLVLRQDNSSTRLSQIGFDVGLLNEQQYLQFKHRQEEIKQLKLQLKTIISPLIATPFMKLFNETATVNGISYESMLRRSNIGIMNIKEYFNVFNDFSLSVLYETETDIKYDGYIAQSMEQIQKNAKLENKTLSPNIDYTKIEGLRLEARQKLQKIKPLNLGQATRISGVSPADINTLIIWLSLTKEIL
ncbi:MAG: tRNA uridine-5-carboxymethylaminomethyl(34) synthesis enzyme MnmG [Clostridia bacterium]